MCRRCGEPDLRGSASDRRRRKLRMLAEYGDGVMVPCAYCEAPLTFATMEVDRLVPGGSYRWDNVVPACRSCNMSRALNAGIYWPEGCEHGSPERVAI